MQQVSLTLSQFYKKNYEAIDKFQGEQIIFTSIHVWDLQAKGDANYTTPILDSKMQEDQNSIKLSSFMEDLMGNEHPTP